MLNISRANDWLPCSFSFLLRSENGKTGRPTSDDLLPVAVDLVSLGLGCPWLELHSTVYIHISRSARTIMHPLVRQCGKEICTDRAVGSSSLQAA